MQSGSYVARLKRRKLDVNRADLLTYVVGGEPPSTAYISSLGSEGGALLLLPFWDQEFPILFSFMAKPHRLQCSLHSHLPALSATPYR